jgi:hypothetical protein
MSTRSKPRARRAQSLQVMRTDNPDGSMQLSIKFPRGIKTPNLHRWSVLLNVKNEVAGPDREAVELYPAMSRCITEGNERNLFVLPEGQRFPFGMTAEEISNGRFEEGLALSVRNGTETLEPEAPPIDVEPTLLGSEDGDEDA